MVANPERRTALLDAALDCLGREGARSLTFRTVDRRAAVPIGTTSNYFASRESLLLAVAERAFARLAPDPERVREIATIGSPGDALVAYVGDVVERLLSAPQVALALTELKLEAGRNPALAEVLQPFLRRGLMADREFHARAGLPGGDTELELLHYAIDGLVLDKLTIPLVDSRSPAEAAALITRRLVGGLT